MLVKCFSWFQHALSQTPAAQGHQVLQAHWLIWEALLERLGW